VAGFDPQAATAALVARIPAAAQAAAERQAGAEGLAWALGLVGPAVIAAMLVRSGVVERTWRWGAARGAWAAWVAVVGLTAVVSSAWEALAGVAAGSGPPGPAAIGAGVIVRALLFSVLLAVLSVARERPRIVLGGLAIGLSFGLVFGPTLLDDLRPSGLQPAPAAVAEAAREVARASGVSTGVVGVTASAPGEGDVVGLLRPPEASAAGAASLPEVRAGLGHVLGHYRARDGFGWALVLAALGAGGVVFVITTFEFLTRSSPGMSGDVADPRALPVLWALAAVWIALAQPLAFAWDRAVNLRADRFSLEHAREPDGLALALIRENGLAPVDPPVLERWIVCSHPPLKDRIDQAMRWKADHVPDHVPDHVR
jgi:STE24 endopeptidase